MMAIRGDTDMYDTNNPVEYWHNLVKNVHDFNMMKVSEYVEQNLKMINGEIIQRN